MSALALHINRLCKSYGKAVALAEVSLDIAAGEFFGLVGANGAGKTTLVKCALDFCDIQSGSISIFGTPHQDTVARSRIAFLPERFMPPHYLSGRDFLRYLAELHQQRYEETRARAMLESLELDAAALDKPARAYSKGMTQKLGLAACLLSAKDLLILDEPTSGLDPKARALLKRELRRQHESGKTVVMTTHALHDVGEMCGRMAVVDRGRLLFAGTPAEFVRHHDAADLEQAYLACVAAH
ncbi:MAG: ABC transporter ATP-binding protein [Burkholderiales bacterium]|nr:ABC transporter ATP-binding protein [Burkholderiales bacterium]MDP2399182.1 ABC transporter ATP-binding protein [Burkholderiales bacterium]